MPAEELAQSSSPPLDQDDQKTDHQDLTATSGIPPTNVFIHDEHGVYQPGLNIDGLDPSLIDTGVHN